MTKKEIVDSYVKNNQEKIQILKAESGFRWQTLADELNEISEEAVTGEYVRGRFRDFLKDNCLKTECIKETCVCKSNTNTTLPGYLQYTYQEDRDKGTAKLEDTVERKEYSDDEIYAKYKVNKEHYRISSIYYKDQANDTVRLTVLFAAIKKADSINGVDFKKEFEEFISEYNVNILKKDYPKVIDSNKTKENALIISLSDLHLDLKSFKEETGKGTDISIATEKALKAVHDILHRAYHGNGLEKIIIIGGNDFYHANTGANTTQKGTPLDVDNRYTTSFKAGLHLMSSIINSCLEYAPVDYYTCYGNHSPEREFYLAVAIEALYRKDNRVMVETGESTRKYFSYGNSSFMLSHDAPKTVKDCPIIFATEKPELFTKKFKFLLTGHLHSKNETFFIGTSENHGLVWKRMPSLANSDKWHFDSFFVGNQKSCIGLVINKEHGEIAEYIYND